MAEKATYRMRTGLGIVISALWGPQVLSPHLRRDLGYFVLLQLFSLTLAVLSAWLGYTRTLSLCIGFLHAEWVALGLTVFVAGSAYVFVSHSMGQVGFWLQGGRFSRAQKTGLVLSLLLAFSIITLDLYLNFSSVKPVAEKMTERPSFSQAEAIMTRYDSLIAEAERKVEKMTQLHFLYKGRVYVPDAPSRFISQEILDAYAALQQELTRLRQAKSQELANDAQRVEEELRRYSEERMAKVDTLSWLVGLMYFLMVLASTRAGMFAGAVWAHEEGQKEEAHSVMISGNGKVVMPVLATENGKANLPKSPQPRQRGIDQEKYLRFLRVAEEVLADRGKYVKSDIAKKAGISRDTVTGYLKRGIERGDLLA